MSEVMLINQATLGAYEALSANVNTAKLNLAIREAQELDLRVFLGKAFYDDFIGNFSNAEGIGGLVLTSKATTAANGKYANQALIGGSGTGATATFQVLNGYVMTAQIVNAGSGYQIDDILTCAAIPNAIFTIPSTSPELVISGGISTAYSDLWNGKQYTDKAGHGIVYPGIAPYLAYSALARYIEMSQIEFTSTGTVSKNHDDAQTVSQKDIVAIANRYRTRANAKANDIEQYLYNNLTTYPLWRYNERTKNARQPGPRVSAIDRTDTNSAWGRTNWPWEGGIYP